MSRCDLGQSIATLKEGATPLELSEKRSVAALLISHQPSRWACLHTLLSSHLLLTHVPAPDSVKDFSPAQIAGQFDDAANPNTRLGKAIRSACVELEHLNSVVSG